MIDSLQLQSLTSYIDEIRKIDPPKRPGSIIPIKIQVKPIALKMGNHIAASDIPFEEWSLPPQPEGYIKGNRHDFL